MTPGAIAVGIGVGLLLNMIWLLFLSDMVARFVFRTDPPFYRALKSVIGALVLGWAINIAIVLWSPFGPLFVRFDWIAVVVDIVAPVLVFLWEWRSFERHWSDDDAAEVIE